MICHFTVSICSPPFTCLRLSQCAVTYTPPSLAVLQSQLWANKERNRTGYRETYNREQIFKNGCCEGRPSSSAYANLCLIFFSPLPSWAGRQRTSEYQKNTLVDKIKVKKKKRKVVEEGRRGRCGVCAQTTTVHNFCVAHDNKNNN
jgi:hypothetical protein